MARLLAVCGLVTVVSNLWSADRHRSAYRWLGTSGLKYNTGVWQSLVEDRIARKASSEVAVKHNLIIQSVNLNDT